MSVSPATPTRRETDGVAQPRQATTADILLETLSAGGVDYVFANFGTDYPAIIESVARHAESGEAPIPRVVIAQHEMVAVSAAMGYAQVTGRPQAVMVHVDVGTQNLGAGVHNAARSRVPVLLFAGLAPLTAHGELTGSRDNPVHYVQDVYDQSGIVREYVKWEYELRTAHHTAEAVARALQVAATQPGGPVYLCGTREVMEQTAALPEPLPRAVVPQPSLPDPAALERLAARLRGAEHPLLITSYAGQRPGALEALVRFAERFGVGVVETRLRCTNFPGDHPQHLGYASHPLLPEADLVIVLDCDVPWVPSRVQLRPDATVVRLDAEPLQRQIPFYPYPAAEILTGDARLALSALADQPAVAGESARVEARARWCRDLHLRQREAWRQRADTADKLTGASLSRLVGELVAGDALILNETVTNDQHVFQQVPWPRAGRLLANGGSGLGWGLGAAFGAKLAAPERDVLALLGDGAYFFGQPTAVHWAQRAYAAPFLTVIYDNGGWNAVDSALRAVHPSGSAARSGLTQSRFPQPPELSRVVSVVDGYGRRVDTVSAAREALAEGLAQVRRGVPAVVHAVVAPEAR